LQLISQDRVAGSPQKFTPNARYIAHIDIDEAEIDKVKKSQWSHVADARNTLLSLMEFGDVEYQSRDAWLSAIAQSKTTPRDELRPVQRQHPAAIRD